MVLILPVEPTHTICTGLMQGDTDTDTSERARAHRTRAQSLCSSGRTTRPLTSNTRTHLREHSAHATHRASATGDRVMTNVEDESTTRQMLF